MDDISIKALETFQKNLKYFEENHKTVFDKINLLNLLIEEGDYAEHYALEYTQEGYFDILELCSNEYLYKENSIEHAKRIVDTIDFKRTGAVFHAQRFAYADEESAEIIDKSELSFHNAMWATIKIINYTKRYAAPETHMYNVGKIIFLDVGLGLHLEGIIKKLNPQVIFIKEKNLETFRLSLFVTDYERLTASRYVYFSITDDAKEERENFIQFLNLGNNLNLHMKHIPFTLNYENQLQRLQTHILSQSYINYGYSAELLRYIDSPRYIAKGHSFLNISPFYRDNVFSSKPVLFLFSGPSTAKNIEWVQANHHRFIVVSALSTCRLLNQYNITPDIVMHIDPGEDTALLFDGLDCEIYFKNTIAILASNVDEATVVKLSNAQLHFIDQGTNYKRDFGTLSAPSVGEYSYALFLIFGVSQLFMLGIDFALDSETLQSHSGFHPYQSTGTLNEDTGSLDANKTIEYVPGNFLDKVPTFPLYRQSIGQFILFTNHFKRDYHNVYNLSNGAYLKDSKPLHIIDYEWDKYERLDKNKLYSEITNFLHSISSSEFSEKDKDWIRYQIQEAKKLEKIVQRHQKKKFADPEQYLHALSILSIDLSDMERKTHSYLAQVYYEFFLIILSYIFDLFNTQELENPHKHVMQIDKLTNEQIFKISKIYISSMEKYLK